MHIHICIYIYAYIHAIHIIWMYIAGMPSSHILHAHIHTKHYMDVYTCVHMRVFMCVYVSAMYVLYTCVHMRVFMCAYVCACMHVYCTYTYRYEYSLACY